MVYSGHSYRQQVRQAHQLHRLQVIVTVLQETLAVLLQVQEPESIISQSSDYLLTITIYLSQSVTMLVAMPLSCLSCSADVN